MVNDGVGRPAGAEAMRVQNDRVGTSRGPRYWMRMEPNFGSRIKIDANAGCG
jgi:hypothetical protein